MQILSIKSIRTIMLPTILIEFITVVNSNISLQNITNEMENYSFTFHQIQRIYLSLTFKYFFTYIDILFGLTTRTIKTF